MSSTTPRTGEDLGRSYEDSEVYAKPLTLKAQQPSDQANVVVWEKNFHELVQDTLVPLDQSHQLTNAGV